MFVFDMNKLRPADQSSASIRAATERVKVAAAQATANVEAAKAARDGLLLDGTAAELKKADAALIEARETVERIEAMQGQLSTRLVAAERRELIEGVAAKAAEADKLRTAFNDRWARDYERVKGELIGLLEANDAASIAASDWWSAYSGATRWHGAEEAELSRTKVSSEIDEQSINEISRLFRGFPDKM